MQIDALVEQLWNIREELRMLTEQEKELKTRYELYKRELLFKLDEQGVSGLKTPVARVTITELQVAKLTDWEAFTEYVLNNNAFHLLQKRPAANAIKELTTIQGSTPPGIELLTLRDVTIRG